MIIGAFKGHDSECEEEAVLVRRFAFGRENEINWAQFCQFTISDNGGVDLSFDWDDVS